MRLDKCHWHELPDATRLFDNSLTADDDYTVTDLIENVENKKSSLYKATYKGQIVGGLVVSVDFLNCWLAVDCIAIPSGNAKLIPLFFPALAKLAEAEKVGRVMCEVTRAALLKAYCDNGFYVDTTRLIMDV